MENVRNGSGDSGVHSDDDVIVLDSDTDEEPAPVKMTEPSVATEIVDLDDDEGEQIDVSDLIWGDDKSDQSLPTDPVVSKVRRPQYNLESSSSDDDSSTEYTVQSTKTTVNIHQRSVELASNKEPVVYAPIIPQVRPVEVTRKVREPERTELLSRVQQNQNHPKKIAYVQPKVQQPIKKISSLVPPKFNASKTKTGKPSVYVPLKVNQPHVALRQQIRNKYNYLPNAASNFSLKKSSPRMKGVTHSQRLMSTKLVEKKKSPMKNLNYPPAKTYSQVKPAVASNVPNTSRMGFLLGSKEKEEISKPTIINRDPRLNRQISNQPKSVPVSTSTKQSSDVPASSLSGPTQIQRVTSDYLSDVRHNKIAVTNSNTVSDKHKKVKSRDSDYDIHDVIKSKRLKREKEASGLTKEMINSKEKNGSEKQREVEKAGKSSAKPKESTKQLEAGIMHFSRSTSLSAKPVSADSILIKILNWKQNWVYECENQTQPPPIVTEPLKYLKTSYESVEEYVQHYVPLLLHEIWAQLLDEYNSCKHSSVNAMMVCCDMAGDFLKILCQVAVRKSQNFPKEGDLVCVEIPFLEDVNGSDQSRRMKAFGYISDHTVETISRKTKFAPNYNPPDGCFFLVRYEVRLKPRSHRLDFNSLMKVKTMLYLKPMLRNAEALLSLKQSFLCCDILKPRKTTCKIIIPTAAKLESPEYNESQYTAILGSLEAVSRPFSVPKLLLIQGPPGTGKTHTLVGMIKKIFSEFAKNPTTPKVLVCAPSNGAIDEIGKRLAKDRKCIKDRQLRLVRIGQDKCIHPEMQRFSIETLAENNVRGHLLELKKNNEAKKKALEDRLAELDVEFANHRANNNFEEIKKCEREMHRVGTEMKSVENVKFEESESDIEKKKKKMKVDLLKKADVVLSTLNSCRSTLVEHVFNSPRTENGFTCVIIDEASQCTEPEILMPLIYTSISKMILIGDPMQLPATVMSKEAARHKYGTSLFERLYAYFGDNDSENPILMLDTQYRMHSEICSFPSKRFYGNKLKTCLSEDHKRFPLRPFIVFNVIDTVHNKQDPKNIFNENEATFVMKLLVAISDFVNESTRVGIITPYNGQKRLFEQKICQLKPKLTSQVNTIDGFQGQEMDVIILSCVRSVESLAEGDNVNIGFLNSFQRINVALTRAKFMLIICVSEKTLKNNELWKNLIEDAKSRDCLKISSAQKASIEQIKQCIKL